MAWIGQILPLLSEPDKDRASLEAGAQEVVEVAKAELCVNGTYSTALAANGTSSTTLSVNGEWEQCS